ncbi:ABC transporter substrate-binding protein [Aeromicrobium terrae]|jgi:ribose transport system substrate-binding protein|uniref:Substrate-binding domain-containing protein n=1 Tax=Aeromicrobium terrae TaxID=2498846 RepID=A0A5C8NLR7_9ACTN|nr:ABC transporter substrate-binding protein [Aeromicrobium terrae]TXL62212.1 substrate-binding domain-containing protein [Aeromicrobium terrae]
MKRTSRGLAAAAAVALAVGSLAACGSSDGGGGGSDSKKIAFIQGVSGDEFYITMQCGIEAEAKKLGAKVTTQGPEKFDPTQQKPIVDSVVASRPDAILVAPTDVSAMQAPLKAASDAGIKVVLVDTTVNDPSFAVSQISSDNEGGGAAAFEAIKELAPDGGKVLVVSTDPGVSTVDARAKGFKDAAAKDSSFQFLGVQYSHNEPTQAAKIVTAALQKDPDIVGIFATNVFSAEGSATGIRQAGKQGKVNVVGFDAGPAQVKQLRDGTVQALIAQQPDVIGSDGVQQAIAALDGKSTKKTIQTGSTIITKDNVDGDAKDAVYQSSC